MYHLMETLHQQHARTDRRTRCKDPGFAPHLRHLSMLYSFGARNGELASSVYRFLLLFAIRNSITTSAKCASSWCFTKFAAPRCFLLEAVFKNLSLQTKAWRCANSLLSYRCTSKCVIKRGMRIFGSYTTWRIMPQKTTTEFKFWSS